MCYEPFVKYGNFSSSDSANGVGAVVEFSCDPGYTLEQGSVVIECVDVQNPQWNETEPACRGESTYFFYSGDSGALNPFQKCISPGDECAASYERPEGPKAFTVCLINVRVCEAFSIK